MPPADDETSFVARTLRMLRADVEGAAPAVAASYTLLGAIVLLGGIGYALDGYFGTAPALVTTGLLLGVVVGLYHLAKLLWRR
jgi:F0F1-type ATP synthase assembly protein I